jgi:hypothetical protein
MYDTYTRQRFLLSERVLHKDYGRKGSVEKISCRESQGAFDVKLKWLAVNRQS